MAAALPEEAKVPKVDTEYLIIKVVGQNNSMVTFRIKKHAQFKKLMDSFSEKMGLKNEYLRFHFDGYPLSATDTPAKYEMEDGDSIDVYQRQIGGTA